jgi:hypothetical protein
LYHLALSSGVSFHEIEGMTTQEIIRVAQAKQEQQKEFFRTMAWIAYSQASLTGVAVNDPKKFPKLENAFPNLFERDTQQDWRVMKERMENYARTKRL